MKTRIITITILAAATAIFAQPRFDWDEVSGPQNRFQRQQQCQERCPQQGYQGQYQPRRDFREQNERPFSRYQEFQGRRAPFARQAMPGQFYGPQNRNMMPQRQAPYAFRGRQKFAPQPYGMGKMRGMQERSFAYPDARRFQYKQAPYAFKEQKQFNGPQNDDMRNRRFAYPNAEKFKEQMRERNFDRERFDAPKGMRDSERPQARHKGLEAKERRGDVDKQCDKNQCPKDEMKAPKAQMAPKGEQARRHPKEQTGDQPQANPQQIAELKLKLRNAIIEKDYKTAGKILEHLEDIDQ